MSVAFELDFDLDGAVYVCAVGTPNVDAMVSPIARVTIESRLRPTNHELYETLIYLAPGAHYPCRLLNADTLDFGAPMHRSHHYLASLFLTVALAAPMSILAVPVPQEAGVQVRIYDKQHKDYHNWDGNENRAWNQYLSENHRESHEYSRSNKREQSQYWNWRHAHPDNDRDHHDDGRH